MIDRNFVKFLKEQYPKGTRVRLNSMSDPYAPVEPGTEGSVEMVDDAGQLLMKWDNGRTLALIPGEDSFSVLPPKLTTLKLYMPMTVDRFESDGWGGTENEPTELSNYKAIRYVDSINAALRREELPAEAERGLMHYYGKNDEVDRKVRKVTFAAEVRDQKLWGVAECQVVGELTPDELTELKEFVSGQASDGFGEGFEQRDIPVPDGHDIHAHLWKWENWSIQTEQECFSLKQDSIRSPAKRVRMEKEEQGSACSFRCQAETEQSGLCDDAADGLPELCFSVLPSTGELICIKRGESGYYPSDWSTTDPVQNRELADENNERLGVTTAQEEAMKVGSMVGWGVPGADPAAYEQDGPRMGGLGRG